MKPLYKTVRKVLSFSWIALIFLLQCQEIQPEISPALSTKNGMLTISDAQTFDKLVTQVGQMNEEDFRVWEKQQGFTSSRTIHKMATELEGKYLTDYVAEHPNVGNVPRASIGYYPEVEEYIKLGILYTDSLGLLQVNATTPSLARLVNEQGMLKVGKRLMQFSLNYVRVIEDGDPHKISQLNRYSSSDKLAGISVYPVFRQIIKKTEIKNQTNPGDPYGGGGLVKL